MKKLLLPVLLLSSLLAACQSAPTASAPAPTQSLTVNLTGVSSARVTVTDTTRGTVLYNDNLASGKVLSGIPQGDVVTVQGAATPGYTTPAAATVTLGTDQTVTLTYVAVPASTLTGVWNTTLTIPGYTALTGTTDLTQDSSGNLSGTIHLSGFDLPLTGNAATGALQVNLGSILPGLGTAFSGSFTGNTYSGSTPLSNPVTGAAMGNATLTMTRQ